MHDAARYGNFQIVPVNWHLKANEIDYILKDCKAKAVVIHADLLSHELQKSISKLMVVVVPTPDDVLQAYNLNAPPVTASDGFPLWNEWLETQNLCDQQTVPFCPPLFYTSGTSGKPKAVKRESLPQDIIQKVSARTSFAWGFDKQPICSVMTGPLYHSAPNGYAHMVLQNGGSLVLQAKFDAEELLSLIEQHNVTHLHMVPTMFSRLLALNESVRNKYDLSSLTHVSHGAAPCPPEVKRQMIEWWGKVIYEYYAMTETGIICCSTSDQWLAHPGSVGCAAPGVNIVILGEDGNVCSANEAGLICVKHEATDAVSYHGAREKRMNCFTTGFW